MEILPKGRAGGRYIVHLTFLTLLSIQLCLTHGLQDQSTTVTTANPYNTGLPTTPTDNGVPTKTSQRQPETEEKSDIYSFLEPGRSYVEYRPVWTDMNEWSLEFGFRTHKSSTFLLHVSMVREAGQGATPNVWVTLKKGVLHITHMLHDESYTLKLAKGLSHDHWHTVQLGMKLQAGSLWAAVDSDHLHNISMSEDTLQSMRTAFSGQPITMVTSLGGFSPQQLQPPSQLVGCMRGVMFSVGGVTLHTSVASKAGVTPGCVNACSLHNQCINGGSCLNYYTHTMCDCFGTGFEGQLCERPGGTVVTLQGSEWISYVISDVTDRTHSPINKVALEFKTRSTEGVLFYGYSQSQYNHLALSLHNSSLHVSVVFVDQENYDELWVALGSRLNDNRWHSVVVSHHGHEVQVQLDVRTQRMTGRENQRHLRMDPAVFIGGLENAHKALGLRSQQKFVGCLRAVYFNHDSVLEKLHTHQAVYHGGVIQFNCQDMEHTALQFPNKGAFVKAEHRSSERLTVELEFRTLKPDSILLYTETISGPDKGYIQILLEGGQVNLIVVPSAPHPQVRETASVGENLNDNNWHSLKLDYIHGTGRLEVDGEVSVASIQWDIRISKATYVGFGPDTQMKYGFVGCMRNVILQDRDIDPVDVVHTQLGVGVTLGPCDLSDLCRGNSSLCQNGGQCVSMWQETYCECHRTHYEGRYCQFTRLRRTCAEYYQAGETRSGVWPVDIDKSGPLPPTHVYCEMTGESGERKVAGSEMRMRNEEEEEQLSGGVTHVSHNLQEGTLVRDATLGDHKRVVTYRGLTRDMLAILVIESVSCLQWVHINCSNSPMRLGELTQLVSASGETYNSFGGDTPGQCGCGERGACIRPDLSCSCDAGLAGSVWDGGYIRSSRHLPVTELIFRQEESQGQANITMGQLRCAGTRSQSPDTLVTLLTPQSFLRLDEWIGSSIDLDFRSSRDDGFLLYQNKADHWEKAELYVILRHGHTLVIQITRPVYLWRSIHTSQHLADGHWHHLTIEINTGQVRVQIDGESQLYDADTKPTPNSSTFSPLQKQTTAHTKGQGPAEVLTKPDEDRKLYVGGRPNNTGSEVEGMAGCIRGLVYNDKLHRLAELAPRFPGVDVGCKPMCDSNPCENGASCEELWSSYRCHCSNEFAHSGDNCQININDDAVSFLTPSDFLEFHQPGNINLSQEEVVLNFRSSQQTGLILYLYDHFNNFLQLEIRGQGMLGLVYNNGRRIVNQDINVRGVADGHWKQLGVRLKPDGAHVTINNRQLVLDQPSPWQPLKAYDQEPFEEEETVVPLRKLTGDSVMYHVYVGGVLSAMSSLPGLVGCVRGVRIGKNLLQLGQSAKDTTNKNIQEGCANGCASSPCQHHGLCVEDSHLSGHFTCDCIGTGYAGIHCDKEVGAYFDGSTIITERLFPVHVDKSSKGQHESLHLNFATYTSHDQPRCLVYITQDSSRDHILVFLSPSGVLGAEIMISDVKVNLATDVSFINGWAHHVSLHREGTHVILRVDSLVTRAQFNETFTFSPPEVVFVGGIPSDSQLNLSNFTGDISNVFFVSDQLSEPSIRPIDSFYGYWSPVPEQVSPPSGPTMSVYGSPRPATQNLVSHPSTDSRGPVLLDGLPETTSPEMWTFPPWSVGPAQTVNLAETPGIKIAKSKDIIAVIVCLAVLVTLAGTVALLLIRDRKRKENHQATPPDEEEGLIEMVATTTEEDGTLGGEALLEGDPLDDRSWGQRGGRKTKPPTSLQNEMNDDENEETPMLSSVEEMGLSRPPGADVDYMQMVKTLPMIDEEEEPEVEKENISNQGTISPDPAQKLTESKQKGTDSGSQMDWEPNIEMKLAQPLMESPPVVADYLTSCNSLAYVSCVSSIGDMSTSEPSVDSLAWDDTGTETPPFVDFGKPISTVSQDQGPGRELWPDTKVRKMREDQSDGTMWDTSEDLFIDAVEDLEARSAAMEPSVLCPSPHLHRPYRCPDPQSLSWTPADPSSVKSGIILGIHHNGTTLGSTAMAARQSRPLTDTCYKSPEGNFNITPQSVAPAGEENKNPHLDPDLPRVSSEIDLTGSDMRSPILTPDWPAKTANSGSISPDSAARDSGGHQADNQSISSAHSSGSSQVTVLEQNAVVTSPVPVGSEHPLAPTGDIQDALTIETGSAYVEPEVIVIGGESDSEEDNVTSNQSLGPSDDPLNEGINSLESKSDSDLGITLPQPSTLDLSATNSEGSTSSSSSLGGALNKAKVVLPEGTSPIEAPIGVSPGLPQRRSFKLKRPRFKSK